ncbi:hypothetical protein RHRU231_950050 [Rhodococcus ruber]|uniref:Uncharacterized protein n=1 Tax=Rhodococcus ruber TaxID=1830 RepID=A0A098BVZ1_9NOCA|nr:hypothetical protein RHRU231_950050 [Rhodococcus ruber]
MPRLSECILHLRGEGCIRSLASVGRHVGHGQDELGDVAGHRAVHRLVQQVVACVRVLAQLQRRDRPGPGPDGLDRGQPVVDAVHREQRYARLREDLGRRGHGRRSRRPAQHGAAESAGVGAQHREGGSRAERVPHHHQRHPRLRALGQLGDAQQVGRQVVDGARFTGVALGQAVPGEIEAPHRDAVRRQTRGEAMVVTGVLTHPVGEDDGGRRAVDGPVPVVDAAGAAVEKGHAAIVRRCTIAG